MTTGKLRLVNGEDEEQTRLESTDVFAVESFTRDLAGAAAAAARLEAEKDDPTDLENEMYGWDDRLTRWAILATACRAFDEVGGAEVALEMMARELLYSKIEVAKATSADCAFLLMSRAALPVSMHDSWLNHMDDSVSETLADAVRQRENGHKAWGDGSDRQAEAKKKAEAEAAAES